MHPSRRLVAATVAVALAAAACSPLAPPPSTATPRHSAVVPTPPPELGLGWVQVRDVARPSDAFEVEPDPTSGPADPNTAGHPGHFPGQATITDVAAVGHGFVAVGFVGADWRPVAWHATDPATWALAEIGRPVADEAAFAVAVTALGSGEAIAVGRAGRRPAVWRSADGGVTWTHTEPPVLSTSEAWERMTAVAAAGGRIVAGGSLGPELHERTARFWTSIDGDTWEPAADVEGAAGAEVTAVIPLDDRWIAIGRLGDGTETTGSIVWRSTDGRSWERIDDPALAGAWVRNVVRRTDGSLVAVGSDASEDEALAWTSSDGGATWTRAPGEASRQLEEGKIRMMDVVEAGGELVAVGNLTPLQYGQGMGWTSRDGLHWVRSPNQASLGQSEPLAAIAVPAGLVAAGPGVLAVGSWGAPDNYVPRVWSSPPG